MRSRKKRGGAGDAPSESKSIFSTASDYLANASEGVLGNLTGSTGPTKKKKGLMNSLFSSKPEPGLESILDALNDQKDLLTEKITKATDDLQKKETNEEQTHAAKVSAENELNILRQHNQMLEKWIDEGTNFSPGQPTVSPQQQDFPPQQQDFPPQQQDFSPQQQYFSPQDESPPASINPMPNPADTSPASTPMAGMESASEYATPMDTSGTPSPPASASPSEPPASESPAVPKGGKRRTKRRLRRYKYSRKRSRLTRGRER